MRGLLKIIFLVLSYQAAFGLTIIPMDQVPVTLTNAAEYGISVRYDPTSNWVMVTMPYTKGEMTFDEAMLRFTNSTRHFHIPINGMQLANMLGEADKPQDMLVIKFQMDRETLHESVLTITFLKRQARGTNYTLSMKDFMARREERNN